MDTDSQDVIVTGIKIPFFSLMMFMIKWVLASIPAIIIGVAIGFGVMKGWPYLLDLPVVGDLLKGLLGSA